MNGIKILTGDCRETLKTLPDNSVHCVVTSPPYFGLRDYGCDGQIGLEATPDEFVAEMVAVFREVRRVLRDDGTCWINLGSSYASGGIDPSLSPLLQRVPSCGSDGTEPQDSPDADRAYHDSDDGRQVSTPTHHAGTARSGLSSEQAVSPPSQKVHDSEHPDSSAEFPAASPRAVQESTIPEFSSQPQAASFHASSASACQTAPQTCSPDAHQSVDNSACMRGTSLTTGPLAVRTAGKESFYSACRSPDCKGIGHCGLCWVSLTIPSLRFKQKDMIPIPWLVAMALQADGWWLRQDIIWHKPNPMPESVTDRCTKSHEYLFLLTKSARYYFDAIAIQEQATGIPCGNTKPTKGGRAHAAGDETMRYSRNLHTIEAAETRNKRSVWTVPTKSYKGAHFATFPPALIKPCILAGCPEGGTVLDPFNGSGTTGEVARNCGCHYIGCELNPDYVELTTKRLKQGSLLV